MVQGDALNLTTKIQCETILLQMKSELEQVKGDVDAIKAELDAERANVHAVSTIYLNSRVRLRLLDFRAHQTTYSTIH